VEYQRYYFKHQGQHIDDAFAMEGYNGSIAGILVAHWETLTRLAELIKKDRGFGRFVRLDDTTTKDDFEKIRGLAQHQCPKGLDSLCRSLIKE
jgi:hypothetical protein